jgi:hypothetical protein
MKDWVAWHQAYDDPSSALSSRLRRVQAHLGQAVSEAPAGPVRVLSLCAGQGYDVIGVLPGHPRRDDVQALLVEADPENARQARLAAARAGLAQVEVRVADAGLTAGYADALPASVLLLCGIFGNISHRDIERTVRAVPTLCGPGATVIWTRNRRPPDLTPRIRAWFAAAGCTEVAFDALDTATLTGIGVHRLGPAAEAGQPPAGQPPAGQPPAEQPAAGQHPAALPAERLFAFGSAERS